MANETEKPRIEEAKPRPQQQQNGGQRNCILWICCPPYSEESVAALGGEMAKAFPRGGSAHEYARWVMKNFDLAPPGSLQPLKDAVRDLAREGFVPAPKE